MTSLVTFNFATSLSHGCVTILETLMACLIQLTLLNIDVLTFLLFFYFKQSLIIKMHNLSDNAVKMEWQIYMYFALFSAMITNKSD